MVFLAVVCGLKVTSDFIPSKFKFKNTLIFHIKDLYQKVLGAWEKNNYLDSFKSILIIFLFIADGSCLYPGGRGK